MASKFAAVAFSLGCIQAGSAYALGLGDLELESFLNEPLNAQVQLLNTGNLNEEQIRIRLATREDFERMGVERAYFLTQIKFEINIDGQGQATISLTSEDPVLEPYLDFIVEARWPTGRLLREYTVLVDPPLFDSTYPVVSASARVAEIEGTPDPRAAEKKSQAVTTTSGTRVDVMGKSKLGPGEMPQRDFNAETTDTPIPGQRYMIHRDDTLWEIALSATPSGATVHQTMLDIQRINPEAFIDGNINRIKAGYIIYMPQEGDISSSDLSAALAEVRQQNEDWQAGRASKPIARGPALRISADPVLGESAAAAARSAESHDPAGTATAGAAEADETTLEQAGQSEQLAAMQQQVDTLQRIVSLKDEQIAALQAALADAGGVVPSDEGDADSGGRILTDLDALEAAGEAATDEAEAIEEARATEAVEEQTAPVEPEPAAVEPAPVKPQAAAPAQPSDSGMMSYLFYGLGALVLAVLAFLFMRRRREEQGTPAAAATPQDDQVFAAVELKEQPVEAPEEPETVEPAPQEPAPQEPAQPEAEQQQNGHRGYGERKHDEYASDVETGDALAEADIYIAYGRYPQAIDLLRGAISSEPSNSSYRLKMLELCLQTGDRSAAENEMRELEAIGDAASIERGRSLLSGSAEAGAGGVDLTEPPAGLAEAAGGSLESDFAGLEIEETLAGEEVADDLDLSADFSDSQDEGDDEDLIIAAEANGMSTKLDLARAYLDMGDDDGARQILEEVMAEGSEAQKSEAGELLERIG